jgi:hydroxymethylbilane synthase
VAARRLRVATRGSALARWQAEHVAGLLQAVDPTVEVELVVVRTQGDRRVDVPIWELGGKGVFVAEVRTAVLDGDADVAVHSAKDLPSVPLEGLALAAVPRRADVRDALVGATLEMLRTGAMVATGSVRRRAQLAWCRPDLRFTGLRGNIGTRLDKVGTDGIDVVVVAMAALERLGLAQRVDEVLEPTVMLPQVGQGALAVECGTTAPAAVRDLLAAIDHQPSHRRVRAERAFLAELGGDCDLPAGALAEIPDDAGDDHMVLTGLLASLDGHIVVRHTVRAQDPEALGGAVARYLLDEGGGAALLDAARG